MEPNPASFVDLLVQSLNLDVEARKRVEGAFEHLEVIDHRPGAVGQPLARISAAEVISLSLRNRSELSLL